MKISIVIPTLNEEQLLPLALQSILSQNFSDYEIIVADAGSTDATVEITKKYGARIVQGGLPAVGRNAGAAVSTGDYLFFFDADVVLPPNFLSNVYSEMQKRRVDLATCCITPLSNLMVDKILHHLVNLYLNIHQYTNPHAPGFCILTTKRLFERAGGFDEKLTLAEDHEFVKRAAQVSPLRILKSARIESSVRRFQKEGRMALLTKYMHVELYRLFKGELYTAVIPYEFGHGSENIKPFKNNQSI